MQEPSETNNDDYTSIPGDDGQDTNQELVSNPSCLFVVTGFGPFSGVSDNPTSHIARRIVSYLASTGKGAIGDSPTSHSSRNSSSSNSSNDGDNNDNNNNNNNNNGDVSDNNHHDDCCPDTLSAQRDRIELSRLTRTVIVETSAQAAQCAIDDLVSSLNNTWNDGREERNDATGRSTALCFVLHLGVDNNGRQFHLETCAYNQANFRVPDERGYQPRHQPIDPNNANLESAMATLLDVHNLVHRMNETFVRRDDKMVVDDCNAGARDGTRSATPTMPIASWRHTPAAASTDPGRFVCNYLYYYSMLKLHCGLQLDPSRQSTMAASSTHQQHDHYETLTSTTLYDSLETPSLTITQKHNNDDNGDVQNNVNVAPSSAGVCRSLFLHVPPFHVIAESDQLEFVAQLMTLLYQISKDQLTC